MTCVSALRQEGEPEGGQVTLGLRVRQGSDMEGFVGHGQGYILIAVES